MRVICLCFRNNRNTRSETPTVFLLFVYVRWLQLISGSLSFQIISPQPAGLNRTNVNKWLESFSFGKLLTELEQCEACPGCRVAYFHPEPFTPTHIHFTDSICTLHTTHTHFPVTEWNMRLLHDVTERFNPEGSAPVTGRDLQSQLSLIKVKMSRLLWVNVCTIQMQQYLYSLVIIVS